MRAPESSDGISIPQGAALSALAVGPFATAAALAGGRDMGTSVLCGIGCAAIGLLSWLCYCMVAGQRNGISIVLLALSSCGGHRVWAPGARLQSLVSAASACVLAALVVGLSARWLRTLGWGGKRRR